MEDSRTADDPLADRPSRRSRRDWFVDTLVFLLAVVFGVWMAEARIGDQTVPPWLLTLDQITGALGCAALWWRRRWPVALALALVPLSTFSELVGAAQLVSLFTVAVHRPLRVTALVSVLGLLALPIYMWLRPEPDMPVPFLFLLSVVLTLGVIGWGLFVRHRRQLVASRRERAVRAKVEDRLRIEQAQHLAREEIAREMHDVLGHRLSLLSVHAGALEYRPDAPPEEIARAAGVIRESAHQALQDLREVVGVLRAPLGELPQPTLAEVPALVADSVRAGMRVDSRVEVEGPVPASVGRTAYRIVQEGLTNAHKHAPGAEVGVLVCGAPGQGVTVEVRNATPVAVDAGVRSGGRSASSGALASAASTLASFVAEVPGTGQGLIGLAERASQAGGRLAHGPTAAGGFLLAAWLPWPP
ncbi:sensor histidine kinase [Actinopolymorpha pittospori]|uniref:histidine kinase n=1 Tax=Actinopolymorpha pittospori TaxID=648752 RepID=A0A927N689_9ACTN|nr:histidine kinase [Actinopolymorpha pittospori]MBE1611753.1 signal transduction histidine kinase [Actinopolymorpha pittospori]